MRVLTIFAHPDDETMLTGGIMALLSRAGADVHYLCATRGEGGELGEPPVCSREEIGKFRQRELACAVESLGGRSVSFLNYIDPLVGVSDELYPYTKDFDGLEQQIIDRLHEDVSLELVVWKVVDPPDN